MKKKYVKPEVLEVSCARFKFECHHVDILKKNRCDKDDFDCIVRNSNKLLDVDYSEMEVKVLASLSKEEQEALKRGYVRNEHFGIRYNVRNV